MTRLFVLLLIALLPLRGWTAEQLALRTDPAPALAQLAAHGEAPVPHALSAASDCAEHRHSLSHGAAGPAAQDPAQPSPHKGCQFCQLCMPLAALQATPVPALPAQAQALPAPHSSRFASAEPARHAKPPIS